MRGHMMYFGMLVLGMVAVLPSAAVAAPREGAPRLQTTLFTANKSAYGAAVVEPDFINGWGLAIRPAGAGGHFWVTAKNISFEYVGDVHASADPALRTLHTDALKYVRLPVGGDDKFATGVVFNDSKDKFTITQAVPEAEPITAPAKFLFASDGGIISAWTERKHADGRFDHPPEAITVIDQAADGAQFFGLALDAAYTKLYAADFGAMPGIKVFGGDFQPLPLAFDQPFDVNRNGKVDAGEYAPFNIQALTRPDGTPRLLVAYAKTQPCPAAAIAEKACVAGAVWPGEEDTSRQGQGRVAEFTETGKLVAIYSDAGQLSAPWGMAFAPAEFGALAHTLLVSNFGSGTIAAFDPVTYKFIDVLRDATGKPVVLDKIWGILFGNGESLGDKDSLYFAAGPEDERDGLFGVLRPVQPVRPVRH
jgi:uncharacterized protein (TIGR03118 family)